MASGRGDEGGRPDAAGAFLPAGAFGPAIAGQAQTKPALGALWIVCQAKSVLAGEVMRLIIDS